MNFNFEKESNDLCVGDRINMWEKQKIIKTSMIFDGEGVEKYPCELFSLLHGRERSTGFCSLATHHNLLK